MLVIHRKVYGRVVIESYNGMENRRAMWVMERRRMCGLGACSEAGD